MQDISSLEGLYYFHLTTFGIIQGSYFLIALISMTQTWNNTAMYMVINYLLVELVD